MQGNHPHHRRGGDSVLNHLKERQVWPTDFRRATLSLSPAWLRCAVFHFCPPQNSCIFAFPPRILRFQNAVNDILLRALSNKCNRRLWRLAPQSRAFPGPQGEFTRQIMDLAWINALAGRFLYNGVLTEALEFEAKAKQTRWLTKI